ncbi:MAG: NADH-quinone oxidoreductase subunit A [Myxococcales bacterium]
MAFHFGTALAFFACAVGFCLVNLLVGRLLRPVAPSADKSLPYECGERPIGAARFNFNPRFYVVALVFVIFEVEIALMLPVALVYRELVAEGAGGVAFAELLVFVAVLAAGLAWAWLRGDLDWVRTLGAAPADSAPVPDGRKAA